jgi:hypothetical protein
MAEDSISPFYVKGKLRVTDAAVVVVARNRKDGRHTRTLDREAFFYPVSEPMAFDAGWEVLLGQNEVINWLRSEPGKPRTMRYPGEWKLPGGNRTHPNQM